MCIYGNSKSINMQSSQRQRNQTNNYFISWRKRRDRPQINIFMYRLWIEFDSSNCGEKKTGKKKKGANNRRNRTFFVFVWKSSVENFTKCKAWRLVSVSVRRYLLLNKLYETNNMLLFSCLIIDHKTNLASSTQMAHKIKQLNIIKLLSNKTNANHIWRSGCDLFGSGFIFLVCFRCFESDNDGKHTESTKEKILKNNNERNQRDMKSNKNNHRSSSNTHRLIDKNLRKNLRNNGRYEQKKEKKTPTRIFKSELFLKPPPGCGDAVNTEHSNHQPKKNRLLSKIIHGFMALEVGTSPIFGVRSRSYWK